MTAITPFLPSASAPFQFQPTLDGVFCTVIVTWNLFGKRYFVSVYDDTGSLVCCLPLIGSPVDYDINIVAGYFTSKLVYRAPSSQFEVSP